MSYCAQVTVGSGKPSASQANRADSPTSAVALTSDFLARIVGRTETERRQKVRGKQVTGQLAGNLNSHSYVFD